MKLTVLLIILSFSINAQSQYKNEFSYVDEYGDSLRILDLEQIENLLDSNVRYNITVLAITKKKRGLYELTTMIIKQNPSVVDLMQSVGNCHYLMKIKKLEGYYKIDTVIFLYREI